MSATPKYQLIVESLQKSINSGEFPPGSQLPTEEALARKFQVSRPTAVKAMEYLKTLGIVYRIQGKGTFVSAESPKAAVSSKNHIISVILPFAEYRNTSRADETNILKGIAYTLGKNNYFTMIHYCKDNAESFISTFKNVQQTPSDGIIVYVAKGLIDSPDIFELFMGNVPIVFVDKTILGVNFPSVRSDDHLGGYLATKHLVDCGYKNIYFLNDFDIFHNISFKDRYLGFCDCVQEYKTSAYYSHYMVNAQDDNLSELTEVAKKIMKNNADGSRVGLFCTTDYFARRVYNVFKSLGADIPNQYGIIGYDGIDIALDNNTKLTTVFQDFYTIGKAASKLMMEQISNPTKKMESIKTPVRLILGNTTSE